MRRKEKGEKELKKVESVSRGTKEKGLVCVLLESRNCFDLIDQHREYQLSHRLAGEMR